MPNIPSNHFKLFQLKGKKRSLKEKNRSLREKNHSLEENNQSLEEKNQSLGEKNRSLKGHLSQLQQLNSDLQQKLLYSNTDEVCQGSFANKNDKAMKRLLKSITPHICDNDEVCISLC